MINLLKHNYMVFGFHPLPPIWARRCGAKVAGWTVDRTIQVRFPAYRHRVWALCFLCITCVLSVNIALHIVAPITENKN